MYDNQKNKDKLAIAASQKDKEKNYWLNRLSGELPKNPFAADLNRSRDEFEAASIVFNPGETFFSRLMAAAKNSDQSLHVILLAGLILTINKITGDEDIILGTPIYKQQVEAEFTNTVLVLRNFIHDRLSFKNLLLQTRTLFLEALAHQSYPYEILAEQLEVPFPGKGFALFDVALLLKNIQEKSYFNGLKINILFSFLRKSGTITGEIEYNALRYKKTTIERIAGHFAHILQQALINADKPTGSLEAVTEAEKKRILYDFNGNKTPFDESRTIRQFFADQVKKSPGNTALLYNHHHFSYRYLYKQSDHIARYLTAKGIGENHTVGILMERSQLTVLSILAAWKVGAAYIPLAVSSPAQRITGILTDSNTRFLLTTPGVFDLLPGNLHNLEIIELAEFYFNCKGKEAEPSLPESSGNHLAYIIYTSGSTGKPKGATVEQRGMMNHMQSKINTLHISAVSIIAQNASFTFDISVWQFFAALIAGGRTIIYPRAVILDMGQFISQLVNHRVGILEVVPSYLTALLDELERVKQPLPALEYLLTTGETIKKNLVERWFRVYPDIKMVNAYGPTEASDDITHYVMSRVTEPEDTDIPIGKPVQNLDIYIVDKNLNLCPIGVIGEICVSGVGVGGGYLNKPELTAERFIENPIARLFAHEDTDPGEPPGTFGESKLYLTGDIGTWLPDGNIRFFGRKDYQVKIRGFRIELGEIENKLLTFPGIKEVYLVEGIENEDNRFICAYYTTTDELDMPGIKQYLSKYLPEYMIPAYFIRIKKFPYTVNGKIDRNSLPAPSAVTGTGFAPPTGRLEKKLASIWSEVLHIEGIGDIDADFFDMGGNSLKAVNMISRIRKELKTQLQVGEIFALRTIRELAKHINAAEVGHYSAISPTEKREYYSMSSGQKRLYILQHVDKNRIMGFNVSEVREIDDSATKEKLEDAFKKLIRLHESLRTSFTLIKDEPVQRIHDSVDFTVATLEKRESKKQERGLKDIIVNFIKPFNLSIAPLLKVGLMEVTGGRNLLIVDMHHIIADGVSTNIIAGDIRRLLSGGEIPGMRIQYKDYSVWQNSEEQKESAKRYEAFWREELKGEIKPLNLPIDYSRDQVKYYKGGIVGFQVDSKETKMLREIAKSYNVTLYMLLLAVYQVLLSLITDQEDIIVGTPVAGRRNADLEHVVGMFTNYIVSRNRVDKEKSFLEFLFGLREKTIRAFENQDYPFDHLVESLLDVRDTARNPLFDVVFSLNNQDEQLDIADIPELPDLYKFQNWTSRYDFSLVADETKNILAMTMFYQAEIYKKSTIEKIAGYYITIVEQVARNVHIRLHEIEISHDYLSAKSPLVKNILNDFKF